ncbi:MAG: zinc-dependent metalloprotease [Microbacteriaceae bacterium]
MNDQEHNGAEDEFREMLQRFLSGGGEIRPEDLAKAAGLSMNPNELANLMRQLMNATQHPGQGLNWDIARDQAKDHASKDQHSVSPASAENYRQRAALAELWLGEVTTVSQASEPLSIANRSQWVQATMPVWIELAEPVAKSVARALSRSMEGNVPEELAGMLGNAESMMLSLGGTLFAMQLGQVVGQLSQEVVSGGDIGMPLFSDDHPMVLPQNIENFSKDLDVPEDQIQLYLTVRELAHARIFRHAKWLRLALNTAIAEHAQGFTIDTQQIIELSEDFDPSNPEAVRELLASGKLIPQKTEAQKAALHRLETILALVEGWVDLVTEKACSRLPKFAAIAEAVRRRRATGGPAESAFSTLVGLELRPKLLREATAMWRQIGDVLGVEGRDDLWDHPDILPSAEDIQDPSTLIASLKDGGVVEDEFDEELRKLLDGE